jgi:predicted Zn-dependent protease
VSPVGGRLASPEELVDRALRAAKGERCVVLVEDGSSAELRFANNTTTTNGLRRDRRVSVARMVPSGGGLAVGTASASGAAVGIEDLVAAAEADARSSAAAEDAAPLLEGPAEPGFSEAAATTDLAAFVPLADALRAAFAEARAAGRVLAGFATHEVTTIYLGSSTGIRRRYVDATGTVELAARDRDGATAWAGRSLSGMGEADVASMATRLAERLAWSRRQVELPAGRYEVILPPDAVADLVVPLAEAASGREAEDGWNVFSSASGGTRLGEQLFDTPFDLRSDPLERGLECIPFLATSSSGSDVSVFDNGAPLGPTRWIDGGRLARLRYHRAGAARSGVPFTPPVDNLVLGLEGASASLEELVAGTRRGLLLTCLWYLREVDLSTLLLTGLTRDGVYLVEDGEVVGAVNNFRFNESPLDVLGRAVEAGRTERALSREWGEWMRRSAMPSLRVAEFNMSSVSPAS